MFNSLKFYTFFILLSMSFVSLIAQPILSNHSFSKEKNLIGMVSLPGAKAKFKLSGENAHLFNLKGNNLFIRKENIKPDIMFYDLTIKAITSSGETEQTFSLVHDQFIKNRVIAHRGAWKNTGASENSIAALQYAIDMGCQGSEFDVHMSSDSVLVVNHDPSIQGKTIHTSLASELLALKLASGENMPSLESYIKAGMTQNKTKLILEIKPTINKERALQLTNKVYELVKKLKAQAWIDYISFDYNICLELLRLDPHARVAYLNGDKSPELLAKDKLWGLDYNQSVFQKNPDWIAQAKQKGLTINAWTVNDPKLLQYFLDQKIDFITTNEPELLLKMIVK